MQVPMTGIAIAATLLFAAAEFAEYRRRHRRDVDKVGFMPWRGVALVSIAVALMAGAVALHS